jgi:hypothetical protein
LALPASAGLAAPASAGLALTASAVAGAEVPDDPPLKSVAYQPEPLSWKPAAVSCLLKEGEPQEGHFVRGSSDIFCKTSLAWRRNHTCRRRWAC